MSDETNDKLKQIRSILERASIGSIAEANIHFAGKKFHCVIFDPDKIFCTFLSKKEFDEKGINY